jgi:hypothetical protein
MELINKYLNKDRSHRYRIGHSYSYNIWKDMNGEKTQRKGPQELVQRYNDIKSNKNFSFYA